MKITIYNNNKNVITNKRKFCEENSAENICKKAKVDCSVLADSDWIPILREADWSAPRVLQKSSNVLRIYFTEIKLLMKSANGTLYSALEKATGKYVAIKQFAKRNVKS